MSSYSELKLNAYVSLNGLYRSKYLCAYTSSYLHIFSFISCNILEKAQWLVSDMQEELMRGKPGYEHLNEPLHILVEAELPVEIIDARLMQAREILEDLLKPVVTTFCVFLFNCKGKEFCISSFLYSTDLTTTGKCSNSLPSPFWKQDESQDFYKKQQLRELAMLNGTLRDEGSQMSGSVSPFNNTLGMKRAKTRGWKNCAMSVWDFGAYMLSTTDIKSSPQQRYCYASQPSKCHWGALAPLCPSSNLFL